MDPISHVRIWPLAELEPLVSRTGVKALFKFADYLIESHWYSLDLANARHASVFLCGGGERALVASTFAEFIELLKSNSRRLYEI
jgi:hypothetical protein